MPRIARVVVAGVGHHVTHGSTNSPRGRGNRRQQTFFLGEDYQLYIDLAAARYIETNPVRAGLAARPVDWPWSSARAHLAGEDDIIVNVQPLIQRVPYPWSQFLDLPVASDQLHKLRQHSRTGRPLGDRAFLKSLERKLHIPLLPKPPGPKPKTKDLKRAEKQNKKRNQK